MTSENEKPKTKGEIPKLGFITTAARHDGHFSGCLAVEFTQVGGGLSVAEQLNAYADSYPGRVLTHMQPLSSGGLLCFFTYLLDEDELWVMKERADAIEKYVEEKREEKYSSERAQLEAEKEAAEETTRLADVGRKCEHNHRKDMKLGENVDELLEEVYQQVGEQLGVSKDAVKEVLLTGAQKAEVAKKKSDKAAKKGKK